MTSLVSARNVTKSYGDLRAVDNVSFELEKGRITIAQYTFQDHRDHSLALPLTIEIGVDGVTVRPRAYPMPVISCCT